MSRRIGSAVVLIAVGVGLGAALRPNVAADQPKEEKEKPIPLAELQKRGVLGDLNHPLGTIVTVEGVAAADDYRRMKADLGHTLLRVQSVKGDELKKEVVFHYRGEKQNRPKVDAKFKYTGYETGGFGGIVEGESKYIGSFPGVGYGFRTSFHILKDELNEKK